MKLMGMVMEVEAGNQSENVFTYKGTDYQLDEGYMEDYGEGYRDGSYNIDLTLISDDETNGIYFEMFTSTDGDLKTGTYNYDSDETEDPGTFDYGDCWGPDEEIEINGGTVRIQKSGNTYTITINVSSSGNSISGYYKGPLDK